MTIPSGPRPERLPTATVAATTPGRAWWQYERPDPAPSARPPAGGPDGADPLPAASDAGPDPRSEASAPSPVTRPRTPGSTEVEPPGPSGLVPGTFAAGVLVLVLVNAQYFADDINAPGIAWTLLPLFGVLAAAAFGARIRRHHPDEPWLPRMLVLGVTVKLAASIARYFTLVDGFGGVGDATGYHRWGVQLVDGTAPPLTSRQGTNFVRWFTGEVYGIFGPDMVTGFLVFGLLAFVGSYCWYRATAMAVPFVNRKVYAALVFFAPSVAFWPSSIGKESLMTLGVGVTALGIAHVLDHRLLRGALLGAAGGWLIWVVRPHLLALVVLAGIVAYAAGRSAASRHGTTSLVRPFALIVLALVGVLVVNEAARFLGIEQLNVSSVEAELDAQTERTAQGGSEFERGQNSLSPLRIPQGLLTVLFRPFPWEAESGFQVLASLEAAAFGLFFLFRFRSVVAALRRARDAPFLLFCASFTAFYGLAFSSFANFGLLVRQRSLMLPAFFVLLAIDVARTRPSEGDDDRPPSSAWHHHHRGRARTTTR